MESGEDTKPGLGNESDDDADESKLGMQENINDDEAVSRALSIVQKQTREAIDVLRKVNEKSQRKALFPEVDQMLHIQCVYKKPDVTHPGRRTKRMLVA
ncbi:unnamed protein product, partial [Gongylonema pulchrum]|uniref:Mediator complex subunit 11 n=1 Tax=Gongylonema pulchrum TaxID=637853 RepID=A0A183EK41_9BILA